MLRIKRALRQLFLVLSRHKRSPKEEMARRVGESWNASGPDQPFTKRTYRGYGDYIAHQKHKLDYGMDFDLTEYDVKYRQILHERLQRLDPLRRGTTVLCLAARIGTEVKSFLDIGCFAIGIDLNPGESNPYVVYGDFHDLRFPSESVDIVFTNSIDHVFDIEKVIGQIQRVLKKDGHLILEVAKGSKEGEDPGFYESFWWRTVDDVVSLFETAQFTLIKRSSFDGYPWPGEQLCFARKL